MIDNLIRNAYLDNLGSDWIAVAANGHPIARATTEEGVRKAAPDAVHFVNASLLDKRIESLDAAPPEANPASAGLDAVKAQGTDESDDAPVADGSAFDHDNDGHVGGSKSKKAAAKK